MTKRKQMAVYLCLLAMATVGCRDMGGAQVNVGHIETDARADGMLSDEALAACMKASFPIAGGRYPVGFWLETVGASLIAYAEADVDGDAVAETILHYSRIAAEDGFLLIRQEADGMRGKVSVDRPEGALVWYPIPEDFPLTGDLSPDAEDPMIGDFDIRTIGDYPAFEAAIRTYIDKESGELTRRDFLRITRLNLSETGIRDLTPVRAMPNLVMLTASGNGISDLSPLRGLRNLYVLDVSDNAITDITPLAELENLATLVLSGNEGVDITPVAGWDSLVNVEMRACGLTDIAALAGLAVTDLDLSGNQIRDITALGALPKLERLKLNENPITDLTALRDVETLQGLYVVGCPITDYSPVAYVQLVEPYVETGMNKK